MNKLSDKAVENVDFARLIEQDLDNLHNTMSNYLASNFEVINDIASFILKTKGKMVRPRLIFAITRALAIFDQKQAKLTTSLAMVLELIHVATLLHDDVIDNSKLRRKKASANTIWGNHFSILMGDYLFSSAFCSMMDLDSQLVLESLASSSREVVTGEILQTNLIANTKASLNDYIEVIDKKTAALFKAATSNSIRLIINKNHNLNKIEIEKISSIGQNLGIMFQLIDDLLDYTVIDQVSGKPRGNDFVEKKITYPIIIAYKNGTADQKKRIDELFEVEVKTSATESSTSENNHFFTKKSNQAKITGDSNAGDKKEGLAEIISILKDTNSLNLTFDFIKTYQDKLIGDINLIADKQSRKYLTDLVCEQVSRVELDD